MKADRADDFDSPAHERPCLGQDIAWYARRYRSVAARSREVDPDVDFRIFEIGRGRHASRLATVAEGDVYVLDLRDEGGIGMEGTTHREAITAAFLWGREATFNGADTSVPRLRLLGPDTEFHLRMPEAYRLLRVGVRGAALDTLGITSLSGGRWTRPGVREPRFPGAGEVDLQERLIRTTRFAEAAARCGGDMRPAMAVAATEAGAALARLMSGATAPGPEREHPIDGRAIVRAAIGLLEERSAGPVSVSALCVQLGVKERTLQRAFRQELGLGVRAYERRRRLRAVHGTILQDGDRRSITDIAMSFGFWHLGRFSGAYASLYGCSPRETRRRIWGAEA